jgi:hypothetical protein
MALTTVIEAWGKMKYCQIRALAIEAPNNGSVT